MHLLQRVSPRSSQSRSRGPSTSGARAERLEVARAGEHHGGPQARRPGARETAPRRPGRPRGRRGTPAARRRPTRAPSAIALATSSPVRMPPLAITSSPSPRTRRQRRRPSGCPSRRTRSPRARPRVVGAQRLDLDPRRAAGARDVDGRARRRRAAAAPPRARCRSRSPSRPPGPAARARAGRRRRGRRGSRGRRPAGSAPARD